jgi:hypothetical protein
VKNFNARMARRKRIEAIARTEREKRQAEEAVEDSIRYRSTSVNYEGEEFITRDFVEEVWNKATARRFGRWVRSFSGFERPWQNLVDEETGKPPTEIQGKILYLLNPDEVFENGQVMLKKKKIKKMLWRGFRVSPIRPFLRKREGCKWKAAEKQTFIGRVVRMLRKSDARKNISLFEEDHQGITVQPGWLGISSPRSHMGETPSRKGWWRIYWNQQFLSQAGRIKSGLDYTKIKCPSDIIEWPVPEPKTTRLTIRYMNQETVREFRRGFEGERIIDWAEKTWGVTPEMTAITMNGVDWTPSNYLPQNCIIDFVPRFRESLDDLTPKTEEEAANEVQVYVNILDQERVWNLKKDNEWNSFKSRVDEIADDVKWTATFDARPWIDNSRAPAKNTKIMVNFDLPGGSPKVKLPVTHISVKIQDRDPFPFTVVRNKGCTWKAFLRGHLWENDDRVPCENDEIQIKLAKCGPELKTIQVFVKVGSDGSQILHLHEGREWEHFNDWMKVHRPIDLWSASFDGRPWTDNSRAPAKDHTIFVNITGSGGGKTKDAKMKIWVKIGKAPKKQVEILKAKEDCWDDFRTKITQDVGHDMWLARIFGPERKDKGKKWCSSGLKPNENETVAVQLPGEPISKIDIDAVPAPIFERMVARPKEDAIEDRPIELKDLADVLRFAPPPPNWAITQAEKQANFEVLRTLEMISKWPDPKFAGLFIKNAIAASRFGETNARQNSENWEFLRVDSPVFDLLLQLPLYKWPIPRDHGCFHPFCDHVVNELQSSHLQRAHNRRNILNSEKDKKIKRVWNGESTSQATMADLLNV